ncbi:MAG: FmdB family zinc ribbon protein [Enhygromyxa sp.]
MPIYRYQCTECGAREEHLQKFSDPPIETCGSCGGALSKMMTAAAFHLKGGGWYKDLYASSKSGSGAESKSESKGASDSSSSSGGSDSKTSNSSSSSSGSNSSSTSSSPSSGSTSATPAA